jgi:hypothetical protein
VLAVKATHVAFETPGDRDGRPSIRLPKAYGMLHDEDGAQWDRCSVLIGPWKSTRERLPDLDRKARRYFGPGWEATAAVVDLPPRALGAWEFVSEVKRIYYVRRGNIMGGKLFQHPFKKRWYQFGDKRALLYSRGSFRRLELPDGCVINYRGFVSP